MVRTLIHYKLQSSGSHAFSPQSFLELGLVDDIMLTIAPVLLGDGLRLFDGLPTEQRWDLKNVVAYKNGFVELSYAAS